MSEQGQQQQQAQGPPGGDAAAAPESHVITSPPPTQPELTPPQAAPVGKVQIPDPPAPPTQKQIIQLDEAMGERLKALGFPADERGVELLLNGTEALLTEASRLEQAQGAKQQQAARDEEEEQLREYVLSESRKDIEALGLKPSEQAKLENALWKNAKKTLDVALKVAASQTEDRINAQQQREVMVRQFWNQKENRPFAAKADEIEAIAVENRITVPQALKVWRAARKDIPAQEPDDWTDEDMYQEPRSSRRTTFETGVPSLPDRSKSKGKYGRMLDALDRADAQGIDSLKALHDQMFRK